MSGDVSETSTSTSESEQSAAESDPSPFDDLIPRMDPWPQLGDSLFDIPTDEQSLNAGLPRRLSWIAYQEGYARAVKALVAHVEATDRDQDFLIYPVLFCGRQVIELGLKSIIIQAQHLFREPRDVPDSHDLELLWELARGFLERAEGPPDAELITACSALIAEVVQIDPRSYAFRYPTDTRGQPSFEVGIHVPHVLNLRQIADQVRRLQAFLRAGYDHLGYLADIEDEIARGQEF